MRKEFKMLVSSQNIRFLEDNEHFEGDNMVEDNIQATRAKKSRLMRRNSSHLNKRL